LDATSESFGSLQLDPINEGLTNTLSSATFASIGSSRPMTRECSFKSLGKQGSVKSLLSTQGSVKEFLAVLPRPPLSGRSRALRVCDPEEKQIKSRGMQQYSTLARIHQNSMSTRTSAQAIASTATPRGRDTDEAPIARLPDNIAEKDSDQDNSQSGTGGQQRFQHSSRPSRASRIVFGGASDKGLLQYTHTTTTTAEESDHAEEVHRPLDTMNRMVGDYQRSTKVPGRGTLLYASAKKSSAAQEDLVGMKKVLYDSMKTTFHRRVWRDVAQEGRNIAITPTHDHWNSGTADDDPLSPRHH